jgi:hypothetical protein
MKGRHILIAFLIFIITALIGYILYQKFAFTEDMARDTARKFFNILIIKESNREFEEIYPGFGNGQRIVPATECRIKSVSKSDDGNYDVYGTFGNAVKSYPISIVVDRSGKIVTSRGVSFAYYDKTFEYGKKLGCITGSEQDSELEQIISSKGLRNKLNTEMESEVMSIYTQLKVKGNLTSNFGYVSGDIVITNRSPYNLEYGDISCKVNFYSSSGQLVNAEDVFISKIKAYESESSSVFANASSSRYKIVPNIYFTDGLKNRVKEGIIQKSTWGCF